VGVVRERIVDDIMIRPYREPCKIYVVEDAELLGAAAQNALLKTLEEPPEYVVIILLADRREYFLETVLSRAVKLSFEDAEAAEDPDAPVRGLMLRASRMGAEDVIAFIAVQQKKKETRTAFTGFLRTWFRDVLASKAGAKSAALLNRQDAEVIREYAEQLSFEGIGRILREIDETERKFQANVNFEITVSVLFSIIRTEMEKKHG
jgi:DNA polymerase-3 subunit delta'